MVCRQLMNRQGKRETGREDRGGRDTKAAIRSLRSADDVHMLPAEWPDFCPRRAHVPVMAH